jgi:GntR family transcriptional regulator, carbon starvation induced regulator
MADLGFPSPSAELRTLAGHAFERLRSDLKGNRFKPGERLRFDDMRRIYQIGLAPLREALSRLAATGLVIQVGQKGFRVAPVSLEDLADVIETRRFLEIRALEDALSHDDDSWEGPLVGTFHQFSKASRKKPETVDEYERWEEHHAAFHRALLAGCRSRWLLHFWSTVFDQAERYRRIAVTAGHWEPDEVSDHAELLEAALSRDREKACALLRGHIGRSAERLVPQLRDVFAQQSPHQEPRRNGKPGSNQLRRVT